MRDYYGPSVVSEGNKSLKVRGGSGRLNADVVVCLQYRKYRHFYGLNNQDYVEGIVFYTRYDNQRIINYPKLHYANGVTKNGAGRTNRRYKPTVRMFKNARTYLVDHLIISQDLAPSYFLECLLYNMPDSKFEQSLQITFLNTISWLVDALKNALDRNELENFLCQNEQLPLFGDAPEQWSVGKAVTLVQALIDLWKNWE